MKGGADAFLDELRAQHEITTVLLRYCRGADRCDAALMRSCFHEDAVDEHGFFNGSAIAFCDEAAESLAKRFVSTRHVLGNVLIVVEGDRARCEAYVTATLRMAQGRRMARETLYDVSFAARYLDRFERRGGAWRIAHRLLVSDGTRVDRVQDQEPRMDMAARGGRGADDPSHAFFADAFAPPSRSQDEDRP